MNPCYRCTVDFGFVQRRIKVYARSSGDAIAYLKKKYPTDKVITVEYWWP